MDLKEVDIVGSEIENHWYYRSKAKAMVRLLSGIDPSVILDVGAGSGFFSKELLSSSNAREAWCVDISYDKEFDEIQANKPIHFRKSIDSISADLVLLMDVLEHVDDDVGLLKAYADKVPVGSHFLISVPAFQFLWSGHDVFLEHKRRYRLSHIESVVQVAGLECIEGIYYFGAVFPIAAGIRLAEKFFGSRNFVEKSQLKNHSRLVNAGLAGASIAEISLMKFNRIFGLTAFCLARKI
jgi:SAM-dependent methyltransferase